MCHLFGHLSQLFHASDHVGFNLLSQLAELLPTRFPLYIALNMSLDRALNGHMVWYSRLSPLPPRDGFSIAALYDRIMTRRCVDRLTTARSDL